MTFRECCVKMLLLICNENISNNFTLYFVLLKKVNFQFKMYIRYILYRDAPLKN